MSRLLCGFSYIILLCVVLSASLYAQLESNIRDNDHRTFKLTNPQLASDRLHHVNNVAQQGSHCSLPDALQATLNNARAFYGIYGVSAAMMIPGYGMWLGTSGYSDPTVRDTISSNMLFGIASNTKTFVAALMLQLQEEGVLSLEDPLHKWLPTYQGDQYRYIDSTISIRQLLNHTSGIYNFYDAAYVNAIASDPTRFWRPESILATFVRFPRFKAGTAYEYSNTNYLLAGMIIKAATHSEISTQLHQRLLTPLSLDHTYLAIEDSLVGIRAHPWGNMLYGSTKYDLFNFPLTGFHSSLWTAGAMFSTASSLVRWITNLHGGSVLKTSSHDQMVAFTPQSDGFYGLGVFNWKYYGNLWFGHDGWIQGYQSMSEYFPGARVGIATIQNSNHSGYHDDIAWALFETYMRQQIAELAADKMYYTPGKDTVWLHATVRNDNVHPLRVKAYLSANGTSEDSLLLYDDGLHRDGMSGDGVWGAYWKAPVAEKIFNVAVGRFDPLDSTSLLRDDCWFATAGPVRYAGYRNADPSYDTVRAPGAMIIVTIGVRNAGTISVIPEVTARLAAVDSADSVGSNVLSWGSVAPGAVVFSNDIVAIYFSPDRKGGSTSSFALDIYSNGTLFWQDTIRLVLTDVQAADGGVPKKYSLAPNYPNPFNPSTTIKYELPRSSVVRLGVFDMLGREVSVLVNERRDAGAHEVKFTASALSSGIYLYRLQAGDFVQTRKLLLLK